MKISQDNIFEIAELNNFCFDCSSLKRLHKETEINPSEWTCAASDNYKDCIHYDELIALVPDETE